MIRSVLSEWDGIGPKTKPVQLRESGETFTDKHDELTWQYRMGQISIDEFYRRADALIDRDE